MCDYSLHAVQSRPAKAKDVLVSTGFSATMSRGFADQSQPAIAVCLLPGTEVEFDKPATRYGAFYFVRRIKQTSATFRKVNTADPSRYHDALEFVGGQIVLITDLVEGQKLTVSQLPVGASSKAEHLERTSASPPPLPAFLIPREEDAPRLPEQIS